MEFYEALKERTNNVEMLLTRYLPTSDSPYNQLVIEAMAYSLMAGGKRIRPVFMMEAFNISAGHNEKALKAFMAAMEMIHTYSLIHDDLPAMDNDELRRGLPTCHVKFGENIAILAGDALLNRAFEVMVDASLSTEPVKGLKAMAVIAAASGANGMIGGQVADVLGEDSVLSEDALNYIHMNKTSAIIEASLMAGAILAGSDDQHIEIFKKIGGKIGLAFQIQDDILDIVGDEAKLGKPIFSDEKNKKTTYVTLNGMDASKKTVSRLLREASDLLLSLKNDRVEFMVGFIDYLKTRQS